MRYRTATRNVCDWSRISGAGTVTDWWVSELPPSVGPDDHAMAGPGCLGVELPHRSDVFDEIHSVDLDAVLSSYNSS
ncbi:hypothetical protein GCM10022233_84170 [Streptomyces shaanxiensis]|uniref:Uncharacterized protein n=1 Tax=Streptomyces shaanxiensis TaxID=653357 RepID=A0ABP7WI74_9ACTN